ncbi:hypothetical protein V8G54_031741 [Vigna mungo]|uniref:Uncharacterized protein n=1 Tax=Vigna mungo TaxID=3915 RepID=A0AAQ3RH76_VIGMU
MHTEVREFEDVRLRGENSTKLVFSRIPQSQWATLVHQFLSLTVAHLSAPFSGGSSANFADRADLPYFTQKHEELWIFCYLDAFSLIGSSWSKLGAVGTILLLPWLSLGDEICSLSKLVFVGLQDLGTGRLGLSSLGCSVLIPLICFDSFCGEILGGCFKYCWYECRKLGLGSYPNTQMVIYSQLERSRACDWGNTPALPPSLSSRKGFASSSSWRCEQSNGVSGFRCVGARGKRKRRRTDEIDLVFLFAGATCCCSMLVRAGGGSLMVEWCDEGECCNGFEFLRENNVDTDVFLLRGGREDVEDEDGGGSACVSGGDLRCGDGWLPMRMAREKDDSVRGRRLLMVLALVVTSSAVALMVVNGDDGEIVVVATGLSSLHDCSRSDEDDDDDGGTTESMVAAIDGATARVDGW